MIDTAKAAQAARTRLEHVSRRGQELADAIAEWRKTEPIGITISIADDRLSWEGAWRVAEPPFAEWALILGDAVHHLRAMLDNLLHYIAEQEGATPQQLGAVQFPIVSDPAKWAKNRGRIEMLPERVRVAVEAVQPFQRPEPERASDGLAILAGLNNADKHRIILVSLIQPQTIGHSFSVEFEDGGPSDAGPPRTEFFADMIDGGPAIRHDTSPDRIADVKGSGEFGAQIVVVDDAGNRWGMTSGLAGMATYIPTVLDAVLGAWSAAEAR